jgi:hypothetical protein
MSKTAAAMTTTSFSSVVAVEDGQHAGRARAVAERLSAATALPLTVLVPPGSHGRNGPAVPEERVIGADGEFGPAVAEHLAGRAGVLVVVAAYGGGPPGGRLFDTVAEHVLTHVPHPILVLGPHAPAVHGSSPLLLPVDGDDIVSAVGVAARCWAATFAPARIEVLALQPPDTWPADPTDPVSEHGRGIAAELAAAGVAATLRRVVVGDADPAQGIVAAVDGLDAVVAVAAPRWPASNEHWFATSRRLIRHGPCALLVAAPAS